MTVKPLPKNSHDKSISEFINKGGKAIEENDKRDDWTVVNIRLPKHLLRDLDAFRSKQIGLTRNAWILQIIQKSLSQE